MGISTLRKIADYNVTYLILDSLVRLGTGVLYLNHRVGIWVVVIINVFLIFPVARLTNRFSSKKASSFIYMAVSMVSCFGVAILYYRLTEAWNEIFSSIFFIGFLIIYAFYVLAIVSLKEIEDGKQAAYNGICRFSPKYILLNFVLTVGYILLYRYELISLFVFIFVTVVSLFIFYISHGIEMDNVDTMGAIICFGCAALSGYLLSSALDGLKPVWRIIISAVFGIIYLICLIELVMLSGVERDHKSGEGILENHFWEEHAISLYVED